MALTIIGARNTTKKACETDDPTNLASTLQGQSHDTLHIVLPECIGTATRRRSMKVLTFLLENYTDYVQKSLGPGDLIIHETDNEDFKVSPPSIQLLDLVCRYGYNVNSMGLPQHNSGPLLWNVCSSPKLVEWCLDRGANLVIPNEKTSIDPSTGDIYHTLRLPLLLELVAAFGDTATFSKLRNRGAPLTPGKSWPKWHAPRILHAAVSAAVRLAPRHGSAQSVQYERRISMIRYLLDDVKLDVNGIGSHPKFLAYPSYPHFPVVLTRTVPDELDLREIICLLLDRGADLDFEISSSKSDCYSTALGCARCNHEDAFQIAVKHWQGKFLKHKKNTAVEGLQKFLNPMKLSAKHLNISNLPQEIVVIIGNHLELEDLKNARLTSRIISSKMFDNFRYYISRKRCPLDIESLSNFIASFDQDGLAVYLEEVVFLTDASNSAQDIHPLLDTFFTMAAKHGRLKSLKISTATRTEFLSILGALNRNGPRLHRLSLYRAAGPYTGATDYYPILQRQTADLSRSLSSVRHFSWSLAIDRAAGSSPGHNVVSQQENVDAIEQVLSMIPFCEVLKIFWFKTLPSGRLEAHFIEACVPPILAMTKLKELQLHGVYITASSLQSILRYTTAKKVSLHEIKVRHGSCQPILDLLTSGKFTYFHVDDLYEHQASNQYARVGFHVPGRDKYTTLYGGGGGPCEIRRAGVEATRKLAYSFSRGRPVGSVSTTRRSLVTKLKYGFDGL